MSNVVFQPPVKKVGGNRSRYALGCSVGIVLMLFLVLAGSIGVYLFIVRAFDTFTADGPIELPDASMPAEEMAALEQRFQEFTDNLYSASGPSTLRLSGPEINALLQRHQGAVGPLAEHSRVVVEGGLLTAKMSLPLSEMGLGNRYLNGVATLSVGVDQGTFYVFLKNLEVNNASLPEAMLGELAQQNLAADVFRESPELERAAAQLETVYIEGDALVLVKKDAVI